MDCFAEKKAQVMPSRKRLFSIVFLLLHFFAMLTKSAEVLPYAVFEYKAQGIGHRLIKSLVKEKAGLSAMDCTQECLKEGCHCKSVNYGFSSKKCQLNSQIAFKNGSNLDRDKEFTYIEKKKDEYCQAKPKDMNECLSSPCHQNASCNNTIASFICTCNKGFEGNGINCTDVNECLSSPCDQNASCNNTIASFICTCNKGFEGDGMNCIDIRSCKELKSKNSGLSNGNYKIGLFWTFCDMSSGGWTLLARFSNRDSKAWISNSFLWYDKVSAYGSPLSPSENSDMISDAFWNVKGNEIKITRTDDSSHTALLQTIYNCLGGTTFRSKITSFGNYRNRAVWASDRCRGSCRVRYGGRYKSTVGFSQHSCSSNIQSSKYIGFWCDWSFGDGAVMMIGGGGSSCTRADHGIGITEENEAKFGSSMGNDFGDDSNASSSYALNLWVR